MMRRPDAYHELRPVKRTMKKDKDLSQPAGNCWLLLCCQVAIMLFQRREDAEIPLHAPSVVVTDIALDHLDEGLLAGKSLSIVTLPFQNAPEALHRTVVYAVSHTGHALRHARLFEPLVERPVRVLETTVAMEQGMRIWVGRCRFVKGFEYQWIVVSFAYHIGDDTPVIQVQNGAEIQLVYLHAFIPLEFCHICEPFLVGLVRVELAVQQVFGYVLRIAGMPGAAVTGILDCGPYILCPAYTKHSLVVDMDAIVVFQVIPDTPVSLIRGLVVDVLNELCKLFILGCPSAYLAGGPFVVGRPRDM